MDEDGGPLAPRPRGGKCGGSAGQGVYQADLLSDPHSDATTDGCPHVDLTENLTQDEPPNNDAHKGSGGVAQTGKEELPNNDAHEGRGGVSQTGKEELPNNDVHEGRGGMAQTAREELPNNVGSPHHGEGANTASRCHAFGPPVYIYGNVNTVNLQVGDRNQQGVPMRNAGLGGGQEARNLNGDDYVVVDEDEEDKEQL